MESADETSLHITSINISESGGTTDEVFVMKMEEQPLVMSKE